ncbi:MAG TPA: NAD(P)(+) transhydrogenase (Re/Si-specific) subunit beta, partial [Candidatus Baltobacteraceae bacterium]|nr:NAD(P)(+) transhydrogenase (Re/Si-specific) subunit beta [Candidatus Baltobacteraceae bacterium]
MSDTASATRLAIDGAYLVTAVCFIVGLRYLSSPKTARLGNTISMLGMAIALVATGFLLDFKDAWWIVAAGVGGGALVGIYAARAVKMTAMPQM